MKVLLPGALALNCRRLGVSCLLSMHLALVSIAEAQSAATGGVISQRRINGFVALVAQAAAAGSPIDVGSRKQLFIDNRFVQTSKGVELVFHKPECQNENLLPADREWERARHGVYNYVIQDGEIYRMYYESYDSGEYKVRYRCLAISTDGKNWIKPDVGAVEYKGSRRNNIVAVGAYGPVFIDPFDVPARRYKMLSTVEPHPGWPVSADTNPYCQYMLFSADGANWQRVSEIVLPFYVGAPSSVFWDEKIDRWAVYLRAYESGVRVWSRTTVGRNQLMEPIPFPRKLPEPSKAARAYDTLSSEFPIVLRPDERDGVGVQVYTFHPHKYPYAEDVYVAFPSMWYSRWKGYEGKNDPSASDDLEIHFAVSRDGNRWERPIRSAVVPKGLPGSGMEGDTYANGLVRIGDSLFLYYAGRAVQHHTVKTIIPWTTINARAAYRLDGFSSLDARFDGGEATTPALVFKGGRLELNAIATGAGSISVELLDSEGVPISRRALSDAVAVRGNSVRHIVSWKDGTDVSEWAGKPVRLRFVMRNCQLFAFQFVQ